MKVDALINLIMDDREKRGAWTSKFLGRKEFTVTRKRLITADYTIKGLERLVRIERKNGWSELLGNIGTKTGRKRFTAELRRMQRYPCRLLVVEADISSIPYAKYYSEYERSDELFDWALKITMQYGVPLISIGSKRNPKTKHIIQQIFRNIIEMNKEGTLFQYPKRRV